MPQELLRDVLRAGDGSARARRFSILPISIAAHAVVLAAVVIIPLTASVDLPAIAVPFTDDWVPTVRPPAPPPPPSLSPRTRTAAPIAAPNNVAPESKSEPRPDEGGVIGAPDIPTSHTGIGEFGRVGDHAPVPPAPPAPPPAQVKPVRVGLGIREPKKIVHVVPEYPDIARISRVEGVVILEAVLDTSGRVQSVKVLRSTPLLDEAAIRAVRQWRYTPTELNGVPVPVLMTITVQFTLAR